MFALLLFFASVLGIHDLCVENRCIAWWESSYYRKMHLSMPMLIKLMSLFFFLKTMTKKPLNLTHYNWKLNKQKKANKQQESFICTCSLPWLNFQRTVFACIGLACHFVLYPKSSKVCGIPIVMSMTNEEKKIGIFKYIL